MMYEAAKMIIQPYWMRYRFMWSAMSCVGSLMLFMGLSFDLGEESSVDGSAFFDASDETVDADFVGCLLVLDGEGVHAVDVTGC